MRTGNGPYHSQIFIRKLFRRNEDYLEAYQEDCEWEFRWSPG